MNRLLQSLLLVISFCFVTSVWSQCDIIYVSTSGNDADPGTANFPVLTLDAALSLVSGTRTTIWIQEGSYSSSNILTILDGIHIEGGFIISGGVYVKSSAAVTTITLSGQETVSGVTHRMGFKANAVNNWSLQDLVINTTNIAGFDPSGRGCSNYGVWINNCSGYSISRCNITSGNASAGSGGAVGANGSGGSNGSIGGSGSCDGNYTCCFGSESAPGGVGGAGGWGAVGVPGGSTNSSTTANTNPGSTGTGRNGGGGGAGGKGGGFSGGNAAVGGSSGGGSASAPMNTGYGNPGGQGDPGGDGTNGANGITGAAGAIGAAGAAGTHTGGYFVPGGQAGTGADGAGGSGGAGGGGGGRQSCATCDDGPGNGGAGGGGGGQGGVGGTGGRGGGGTFAIYRTSSNTGANIVQCTLTSGSAGSGGIGGNGGVGGSGGTGGPRRTTCSSEIGEGGSGGNGGNGGNGGAGGNGSFGLTSQLMSDGTGTSPSVAIPITPSVTVTYLSCSNSEVNISNASGNWNMIPSASYINDLNASTTSYTPSDANFIVSYTTTGLQTVDNNTTFSNFVYITTDRPLPTFDASMSPVICEGDAFTMLTPTAGTQYEWVIFNSASTTATPLATYTSAGATWTTPITGSNMNYSVRLRVRTDCCGWSAPVYFDFLVVSSTSGPAAVGATICENQTAVISATGTGAGDLVWYSDPLGQIILQTTPGATSNYTTNVLSDNTVFYVSENVGVCASAITSVPVIVNPAPNPPTSATTSFCEGEDVILLATGSGSGDINFYDITMTLVNTGTMGAPTQTFNAGALAAGSYTYYVTESDGTCESNATAIGALVTTPPAAPTVMGTTICENESAILSASGVGTIYWFADAGLTNQLSLGSNYNTGPLTTTTTYYITQTDGNGCSSPSTSADVVVNPAPVDPTTTNATICEGETATLSSTSSGGTISWYADVAGTNLLGTGASYTTGVLNQTTTFYVQEQSGSGCNSGMVAAIVTVNGTPNSPSVISNMNVCEGSDVILTATGSGSGDLVFMDNTMTVVGTATMGNPTQNYNLGPLAPGSYTYYVAENNGSCNSGTVAISVVVDAVFGSPTIAINATSSNICQGTLVTFTSTVTNEGPNPTYQWYLNGNPVGADNSTFSMATLNDGDQVSVSLISDEYCLETPTGNSNVITMIVNPEVNPTILISANSGTICSGTVVNFNSTVTNEGATPVYDWYVNGVSQSNNSPTFSSGTLNDGDIITANLVSSEACANPTTANSNAITMEVNPMLTPVVSVSASNTSICSGSSVTFTASATDGGTNPIFQWYVNGVPAGSNNSTFTTTGLVDGDVISVDLTSSEACVTAATVSSGTVTMTVAPSLLPTAFITATSNIFCPGDAIDFTASFTNEGATPTYEWFLNGVGTGVTTATYTNSTLNNGDVIELVLTSSEACAQPATVMSNAITMIENSAAVASVSIAPTNGVLCEGESATFLAFASNASSNLNYEWYVNGTLSGTNSTVFNSGPLQVGDVVSLLLIYDDACGVTDSVISNSMAVNPAPIVDAGVDATIFEGESVTLNGQSSVAGTYFWSPPGTLDDATLLNPVATPDATTEYMLTVTTPEGCVGSDLVVITVESQDVVPNNSFSPNDDGINDTWTINNIELHPEFELKIFNRWGNLIYEQSNTYVPWDGNFKGKPLPSETYYYILILDPGADAMKGPITIVR